MEYVSIESIVILAVLGVWLVLQIKSFIQAPVKLKLIALDIAKEVQAEYVNKSDSEKLKILVDKVHARIPMELQRYISKSVMTAIVKDAFEQVIELAEEDLNK